MLVAALILLYGLTSLGTLWYWTRVEQEMALLPRRYLEQPVLLAWLAASLLLLLTLALACGWAESLTLLGLTLITLGGYLWMVARRHSVAYSCRYMARHYDADEQQLQEVCARYEYAAFPVHDFVKRELPLADYVAALHDDEARQHDLAADAELLAYNLQRQQEAEAWAAERRAKQYM